MSRQTIDFGIDLGTTNSCIALVKGTEIEVIRNNEGFEYTPSAVGIDRKGRVHVGRPGDRRLQVGLAGAGVHDRAGRAVAGGHQRAVHEVAQHAAGDPGAVHDRARHDSPLDATTLTVKVTVHKRFSYRKGQ